MSKTIYLDNAATTRVRKEVVEEMKTVNMDAVDIMVIMYDITDHNMRTLSDNPDTPTDVTAFTGGSRTT